MTLNDIVNMIHSDSGDMTVFVFDNEEDRDAFRHGYGNDGYIFSAKSPYVFSFFIKEKFSSAEVTAICPVSCNIIDVIIKLENH